MAKIVLHVFGLVLKAWHTREEQLSKRSREAVSSAVSFRVHVNFGEAKIIKHDIYLSHDLARQKSHQNLCAHGGETAELMASRDFLLSCFLLCVPGLGGPDLQIINNDLRMHKTRCAK